MDMQMPVAEIVRIAANLEIQEFESLYKKLSTLRLQKRGVPVMDETELKLLQQINKEFSANKWERLEFLDWKLEYRTLNEAEEVESLELAEAYEEFSVDRLEKLVQLAKLRRVHIDELMEQLGLKPKARG